VNTTSFTITGGDFDHVGAAASGLKRKLKKLGVPPDALRRLVIAAYEAEANIVVHAREGTLRATLGPSRIDVEIDDRGPGIADVELAMQEGFSTASPAAMALGFGAGMGLPNIKRNSNTFAIESEVGEGTRVRFSIDLPPQKLSVPLGSSVRMAAEHCRACMRCLHVCPTGALRIRRKGPEILGHLCIDCAACIGACETGALSAPDENEVPPPSERNLLVVPASFLAGFGPEIDAHAILDALDELGFGEVRLLGDWERVLRQAALAYARDEAKARPVLSPVCPAVVNLVEMRFPALLGHLAPFLSPIEAAREELDQAHAVVGVSCPAQYSVLTGRSSSAPSSDLLPAHLSRLRDAVLPIASRRKRTSTPTPAPRPASADAQQSHADVLRATGTRHVLKVLDKAEEGLLADFLLVELYACDGGCFGAPAGGEAPSIASARWRRVREGFAKPAKAFRRTAPFRARSGMRLDEEMARAIEKLARIDRLTAELPGKNCGMCGAPTCGDLAEDLVLERPGTLACPHTTAGPETQP